ncbi:MAG TPA: hypothetical protein VL221_04380 [Bacteroidota bacterium]|nr:hypothetical protein [Bacteroidota bacterium]
MTLARKLKLRPGARAAVLGAPGGYRRALGPLPEGTTLSSRLRGTYDWVQVFARSAADLRRLAPRALRALRTGSLLWVSFPKGTSSLQSDLTRDRGWEALRKYPLKWVVLVSVDDTWSAFCVRPFRPGESRRSFR